jgi:L-histidine N-alpha-methyltransferase
MDDGATTALDSSRDGPRDDGRGDRAEFGRHVVAGLGARPRSLSSMWLYDDEGSRLFRRIMTLPGYYPTAAERSILAESSDAILRAIDAPTLVVVDLGAGDASKTHLLLDAARREGVETVYAPIDVSEGALASARDALAASMPDQAVEPVCGDYVGGLAKLDVRLHGSGSLAEHRLVLLLGSNLGNLEHDAAAQLLLSIRGALRSGDHLLVGYDLMKDPGRLMAAYDDEEGVTAAFNLNLLARINRELGGDFDLARFRHRAFYNGRFGRVEMHLVSDREQTVHVGGVEFHFAEGESVRTECSYKYTAAGFGRLAARAGFRAAVAWTDERHWFCVQYLEC